MKTGRIAGVQDKSYKRDLFIVVILAIIGAVLVAVTIEFSREKYLSALAHHRDRVVAAEIALFAILVVEMTGRAILKLFRERDALHLGYAIRAVLRAVSYLVLALAIISLLSANSALAIGIGSFTGLVVGFAFQSTIGNIFAGMVLAINRPFRVGEEITILENRGRVLEIGLIHTLIDGGDQWIVVPSSVLMTNALQRKKQQIPKANAQAITLNPAHSRKRN